MKKIISTILLCVLLAGSILSLASCGSVITGTYTTSVDLGVVEADVTVKFGFGTVTIESVSDSIITDKTTTVYEAKYEIGEDEEGGRTITFTYEEGASEFISMPGGVALSLVQSTVEGVEYLTIGGIKYKKAK